MNSPTNRQAGCSYTSRGAPGLHDPPAIHHRDPAAERQGLGLVVGDVDHRRPEPPMQVEQVAAERARRSGASRLENGSSSKSKARGRRGRPPERNPLPLAPGERSRPASEQLPQTKDPRGLRHRTRDFRGVVAPRARRPNARLSATER